jgi:hypothetical protein
MFASGAQGQVGTAMRQGGGHAISVKLVHQMRIGVLAIYVVLVNIISTVYAVSA